MSPVNLYAELCLVLIYLVPFMLALCLLGALGETRQGRAFLMGFYHLINHRPVMAMAGMLAGVFLIAGAFAWAA